MKLKKNIYFLIVSNFFTIALLLMILSHYNIPRKLLNKFDLFVSEYSYTDNIKYKVQRSLFQVYKPDSVKIVMLGNSIVQRVAWNELLGRTDIANRGIGSDLTEGFLNRLSDIYKLNPEVCFIMGGINDIGKGIPVDTILSNYIKIVDNLRDRKIRPIIQSTLYVSAEFYGWQKTNQQVDLLNDFLISYAKDNSIAFIDINRELSNDGRLRSLYTYDGVHLMGDAYQIWGNLILKELK